MWVSTSADPNIENIVLVAWPVVIPILFNWTISPVFIVGVIDAPAETWTESTPVVPL